MYHFFVSPEQISQQEILITGPDVNHIRNVLRMRPGEELKLSTGEDEKNYRCQILEVTQTQVRCKILWAEENGVELPSKISLFQALPKSGKMELVIQKAVELGAFEIVPVASHRSVVRLEEKKARAKVERWNAVSESAASQSRRLIIPRVTDVMDFSGALQYAAALDVCLIPYERAEDMQKTRQILSHITPGQSVGIFIGPEGGFEETEVAAAMDMGAKPITLGRRILRTETAGMAVLSMLLFLLEGR